MESLEERNPRQVCFNLLTWIQKHHMVCVHFEVTISTLITIILLHSPDSTRRVLPSMREAQNSVNSYIHLLIAN